MAVLAKKKKKIIEKALQQAKNELLLEEGTYRFENEDQKASNIDEDVQASATDENHKHLLTKEDLQEVKNGTDEAVQKVYDDKIKENEVESTKKPNEQSIVQTYFKKKVHEDDN